MTKNQVCKVISKEELARHHYFLAGYDMLFSRLARIVAKKGVNNAIIVGEEGVGKTGLAHGLVYKYPKRPFLQLQNDALTEIIFSFQPEKEDITSIKKIFSELNNAILFIDDISMLFSSEHVFHYRFVSLFKSLLDNPNISIVATIDQTSFRQFIEKDTLFSKSFEIIRIHEPSAPIASKIIKDHFRRFEESYNVQVPADLADSLVALSNRYIQSKKQPAKALNMLDEVCAYVIEQSRERVTLGDIKTVISERTGIPVQEVNDSDREKLQILEQLIENSIKGQSHAVNRISQVIRRSRSGIKDPRRPIGSFLFLGPSGVGKTHLAKTLAKVIYNDENALVRIDMSEFSEAHNVQRLLGAPPGYVGYEEGGQLTNPVWERPYSLILLDEIEKAHPRVFDIFLQVIDEGRLTDGQGKTIDFNNTIIIATSNIGLDLLVETFEKDSEYIISPEFVQNELMQTLLANFRPEFINRFDETIVFKPLISSDLLHIAHLSIQELNDRLRDQDISIEINPELLNQIVENQYHPKFGARPLKRYIREQIEDVIAQEIIFGRLKPGMRVSW
ncbi:MAG: AAA family ATPase [Candidatus Dojkabacteria bacterium]